MSNILSGKKFIKRIAVIGLVISLVVSFGSESAVNAQSKNVLDIYLKGNMDYDYGNKILELVNIEREKSGLSSLILSEEEMKSAEVRARECILRYSHRRPVKNDWTSMIPKGYSHVGENLAVGYENPEDAVKAWMESPSHRDNILGEDYKSIGIGVFVYKDPVSGKVLRTCAQHFSDRLLTKFDPSNTGATSITSHAITVNDRIYNVNLKMDVDKSTEASLEPGQSITPSIKVYANEIWDNEYLICENETLRWESNDPEIADFTTGGSIFAKKLGRTTIRAFTGNNLFETIDVVVQKPIYKLEVNSVNPEKYSGERVEPHITITDGEKELLKGKDYEITYSDNLYPGNAMIKIKGINNYRSERIVYFSIYDESTVVNESFWSKLKNAILKL